MRSLLPTLLLLALAACSHDIRNENAVRQGVIDYLASRTNLNVSSMNVSVNSVVFRKDLADATVSFSAKGSSASRGMVMHYILERKGDRWQVTSRTDSGQNPHGDQGIGPHGGAPPASGELPPGHPALPPDSGAR